jgi:hypothetical protein
VPRPNFTKLTVDKELCSRVDSALKNCHTSYSRTQFVEAALADACEALEKMGPVNPLKTVNQLRIGKLWPMLQHGVGSVADKTTAEKLQEVAFEYQSLREDMTRIQEHLGVAKKIPLPPNVIDPAAGGVGPPISNPSTSYRKITKQKS